MVDLADPEYGETSGVGGRIRYSYGEHGGRCAREGEVEHPSGQCDGLMAGKFVGTGFCKGTHEKIPARTPLMEYMRMADR